MRRTSRPSRMSVISADEGEVLRMFSFARKRRSNVKCQWANADDVRAAGLSADEHNRGGIILGSWRARKGRSDLLQYKGPHHVLVVGPARSGKSAGVTVPTLLNWDESVVIYDTKGENWALTSGFRAQRLGQRVLKFDPVAPDSARFNPLLEVRLDRHMLEDVQSICTLIVDPDGRGLEDHWAKTAFDLLVGVVTFLLLCDPPEVVPSFERSLATVLAILSDGGPFRAAAVPAGAASEVPRVPLVPADARAVFSYIRDVAYSKLRSISSTDACPGDNAEYDARRVGWRIIAVSMEAWLDKPANEAGSVLSTALSFLSLYRDPVVVENTRVSDFSIQSLLEGDDKTSLYIAVSPVECDRCRALPKMIMDLLIRRRKEKMGQWQSRLLLVIDDLARFGCLDTFVEGLGWFQHAKVNALVMAQSSHQIIAMNAEAIIHGCAIHVVYEATDPDTAERFSARRGIFVEELRRIPADTAVVFFPFTAPIRCEKVKYYKDPTMVAAVNYGTSATTGRMS